MLDIGWSELLLVAVVVLVVFGPKELPKLLSTWRRLRRSIVAASLSFRQGLDSIADVADIKDLHNEVGNTASEISRSISSPSALAGAWAEGAQAEGVRADPPMDDSPKEGTPGASSPASDIPTPGDGPPKDDIPGDGNLSELPRP